MKNIDTLRRSIEEEVIVIILKIEFDILILKDLY